MFVGDGVDGSAPWLEAVGDIQEDAQAMAEVSSIVVHEVSSRDVRKLDIEEGPVLLTLWYQVSTFAVCKMK